MTRTQKRRERRKRQLETLRAWSRSPVGVMVRPVLDAPGAVASSIIMIAPGTTGRLTVNCLVQDVTTGEAKFITLPIDLTILTPRGLSCDATT